MQGGTVGGSCRGWILQVPGGCCTDSTGQAALFLSCCTSVLTQCAAHARCRHLSCFGIPWGSSDPHDVSGSQHVFAVGPPHIDIPLIHFLVSVYHPTLMQSDMQGGCVVWLLQGRNCFLVVARSCRLCSLHTCQFPYGCARAHLEIDAIPWVLLSARLLETCCPWPVIAWRSCRCS